VPNMALAFFGGFGAAVGIIIMVLLTGQTFGQRCDRMFPSDPLAADRCVHQLNHGIEP